MERIVTKMIVVPEGMLKAATDRLGDHYFGEVDRARMHLEAALIWMSEHPIVPTYEQALSLTRIVGSASDWAIGISQAIVEWQRRMFSEPEPKVPYAIRDLIDPLDPTHQFLHNQQILEAYRRGQGSK